MQTHNRVYAMTVQTTYQSYDELPVTPLAPAKDDMQQTYLLAPEQLQFKAQYRAARSQRINPYSTYWLAL